MKKFLSAVCVGVFCLAKAHSAGAVAPKLLGEYDDWVAYYYQDSAGMTCYMASPPK